ncbi:hypothetical protein M5689_022254 [Euphorbia peplus]|nr:hypothetical protein M5689_022254 [Euphorbia peplus]
MTINGKEFARTATKISWQNKKKNATRKEAISPFQELEDIDLDKQFVENDNECFWLSSSASSSSPSSFFREYKLSSSLRPSVDDSLISWLSTLADSYLHLDNAEKNKEKNSVTSIQEVSDSENSKFSSDSESYANSDGVDLEDFRAEEPLFWPSESKSDWSSPETWRCFSMSPRKGSTCDSKRRSLEFGSGLSECSSKKVKKMIDFEGLRLENSRKVDEELSICVCSDLLEDNIGEESIETVMGLEEFDGHEGVEYEFNDDVFSVDDEL